MTAQSTDAGADDRLIAGYKTVYTSLVSDILDGLGQRERVVRTGLLPFHAAADAPVVGRAYPVTVRKTDEFVEIDRLLDMVDGVPAGAVVTIGGEERPIDAALWGGLVSTGVQARGGVGAVVDGAVRDLHQIHALDFPVFASHRCPKDIRSRGEVVAIDEPMRFRGVAIGPRDLVVADANGIVVVPQALEQEVLERCLEKLAREDATFAQLREGRGAADVYATYGAI